MKLKPGDRVRLDAPNPLLVLRSDLGVVDRPGQNEGSWIVRLDQPSFWVDEYGRAFRVVGVREHEDNLTLVEPAS